MEGWEGRWARRGVGLGDVTVFLGGAVKAGRWVVGRCVCGRGVGRGSVRWLGVAGLRH